MRLFHGTSAEAAAGIVRDGAFNCTAFLTPDVGAAMTYAGRRGVVVEVSVCPSELRVDMDLPGARLMTVSEANAMDADRAGWSIHDYMAAGISVGFIHSVTHAIVRVVD